MLIAEFFENTASPSKPKQCEETVHLSFLKRGGDARAHTASSPPPPPLPLPHCSPNTKRLASPPPLSYPNFHERLHFPSRPIDQRGPCNKSLNCNSTLWRGSVIIKGHTHFFPPGAFLNMSDSHAIQRAPDCGLAGVDFLAACDRRMVCYVFCNNRHRNDFFLVL